MAVEIVKFVGDSYYSGTHSAGSDIYWRSADASDAGTVTVSGVQTVSGDLDSEDTALTASEGKVEVLTGFTWDSVLLVEFSAARVGETSIYVNNGTAATGSVHVHSQPSDGDTLQIGLTGFTDTITFKTTVSTAGQVKIGATTNETADNLASYLNDTSTGTSTPVDSTDWNATAANAYLSATVSGNDVTVTDRIACARQLAWVTTASNTSSLSVAAINGGGDGTLLATVSAGNSSASASASSGLNMETADVSTATLPIGYTGTSKAVRTGGSFVFVWNASATLSANVKLEASADGESAWYDLMAATGIDLGAQASSVYLAEYVRAEITTNTETTESNVDMRFVIAR